MFKNINKVVNWVGEVLQSPFLLLIRLYWGLKFAIAGYGKFLNLETTSHFFESLGIPYRSLKSVHFYTELSSCFSQAGCSNGFNITTEPSCPQASIRIELILLNNFSRQHAAL